MTSAWLALAGIALVAFAALVAWLQGRGRPADLGHVSEQWLSEHRLSLPQDSANR